MPNNEKRFHENLAIWSRTNPQTAVFLPYLDCHHLTFCKTRQDELNLKLKKDGKIQYYHSNAGAVAESHKWFSSLVLDDVAILYVYGVGLGYDYQAAKAWLEADPNRRLVFLEDDPAVIRRLFETPLGTEIVQDGQVVLCYFESVEKSGFGLTELYWVAITMKIQISALRSYAKKKSKVLEDLKHRIAHDTTLNDAMISEYMSYGLGFFRNFYPNMLHLTGSYLGNTLKDKFKDVPAIICGAGPSLEKQLPELEKLNDRALIFAGGSALNALNAAGLQPHFGAGIDPNPTQYNRLASNQGFEVPFFYRNRMYHRAFKMIHGPRLYIAGSGGYDISEWFEEKFDIESQDLDEGFNVVNFCLEIARMLGCSPIILIGMDLAFTDMQAYTKGVEENPEVTAEEILNKGDLDRNAVLREDIYGQPIYTLWKWITEAAWISSFGKAFPGLLINATEGGLGMKDIPNTPFTSVIETHLTHEYDLSNRIHGEIQQSAMPQVTDDKLVKTMEELRDSLIRCRESLDILIADTNQTIQKAQEAKELPKTLQGGRAALAEIELEEEPGYLHVLVVFNLAYSKVLNREMQYLNALGDTIPQWESTTSRLAINVKKLSFLQKVADAHIAVIEKSLADKV